MAVVQPVFAAGMAALAAIGANAQTIDQAPIDDGIFGPFELSSNIALASDYRGRGVSYTDNSIAIQGRLVPSLRFRYWGCIRQRGNHE